MPGSDVPSPQPLTTFIVQGAGGAGPLAIDAGSLGLVGEAEDMAQVREVILTHAHIDHIATLPMWVEALLSQNRAPVAVHGTDATIAHLRKHFFNGVIFPDMEQLAEEDGRKLLEYRRVPEDRPFGLAGFALEAIRAQHPIDTHGYFVDDGECEVLFASDSGQNDQVWQAAEGRERLKAVILETSFPDFMGTVAAGAGHLTPALLAEELKRAPAHLKIFIAHMKPAYRDGITRAIQRLNDPRVRLVIPGQELEI